MLRNGKPPSRQPPVEYDRQEDEGVEDGVGPLRVLPTVRRVGVDLLAGVLLSFATAFEASFEESEGKLAIALYFKILACLQILLVFVFYLYRTYTNKPSAGQTFYLICMFPWMLFVLGGFTWQAVVIAIEAAHA